MPHLSGRLIIDSSCIRVKSIPRASVRSLLIQRMAADRRQIVVPLRNPSDEVRFLLTLTKLYDLFIVEADYD